MLWTCLACSDAVHVAVLQEAYMSNAGNAISTKALDPDPCCSGGGAAVHYVLVE
jgi:hypothetical protein